MVSFNVWVDVVFEHIEVNLNLDIGGPGQPEPNGSSVMQTAAAVWNDRKAELQGASRAEAERVAKQEIVR